MKRVLATVLAACLALQPLSNCALTARGAEAEVALIEEGVGTVAESVVTTGDAGQNAAVPEAASQLEISVEPQPEAGMEPSAAEAAQQPEVSMEPSAVEVAPEAGTDIPAADTVSQPDMSAELPQGENTEGQPEPGTDIQPVPDAAVQPEASGSPSGDSLAGMDSAGDVSLQDGTVPGASPDTEMQEPGAEGSPVEMPSADWEEPDYLSGDDLAIDDGLIFEDIEIIDEEVSDIQAGMAAGNGLEPETETESESEYEVAVEMETEEGFTDEYRLLSVNEWTGKSYIEVKVISTSPAYAPGTVTVTLSGPVMESRTLTVPGADSPWDSTTIQVLPGTYGLKVSAAGYADYVQTVTVGEQQTAKLEICTSRMPGTDKARRGWLRVGDVDGDGGVTQQDIDALTAAVRASSTDPVYNLNNQMDAVVNIADLQLAVQSCAGGQEATVDYHTVPREAVHDKDTVMDGEGAANLLEEHGSAALKRADGAAISPEAPVSVSFSFADGEEAGKENLPKLDGMTIQSPGEMEGTSDIQSGTAEVEYLDENGETKILEISLGETQPVMQTSGLEENQTTVSDTLQSLMLMTIGADALVVEESVEEPLDAAGSAEEAAGGDMPAGNPAQIPAGEAAENASAAEEMTPATADSAISAPAPGQAPTEEILAEEIEVIVEAEYDQEPEHLASLQDMDMAAPVMEAAAPAERVTGQKASVSPDGSLVLDFGGQIAVKRVTIRITGTKKNQNLAEIAKVEFVNDMESRIPAPEMNIPTDIRVVPANEELVLSWTGQTNVTGYDVEVEGNVKKISGKQRQVLRVGSSPHTIISINDYSLINFEPYSIRVRSVNGEWSSPWSESVTAVPAPQSKPAPVDNVTATGGFRSVRVTWKDMDDADGYMVYYGIDNGSGTFAPVVAGFTPEKSGEGRLERNDYTITGLEAGTKYLVYVIGWNSLGWGEPSIKALAETDSDETPQLPKYRLINTSNGTGVLSANIVQAVCGTNLGQKMIESPLDAAKGDTRPTVSGSERPHARWALGVVDDSYSSYWLKENEWDDGVTYSVSDFSKGVTVTFNQEYEMNYLTFTAADLKGNPESARVVYWNSQTGNDGAEVGCTVVRRLDAANRPYFLVKFHEKVKANQIQLCLAAGYRIEMKIAEMHFHYYDSLDDEIRNLFADDSCTTLRQNPPVTEEEIAALEARVKTPDAQSKEYHPLKEFLLLDLQAARELLTLTADETFFVNNRITAARDGHINFGGLNEWQPLGRVAAAGDELIVYVGHNYKNIGESTNLKLVFTQYHAQSDRMAEVYSLKVGRNTITLRGPSKDNFERGGQLYIAYNGNNANDRYGVRVSGGTKIPVLNIYGLTGSAKTEAISRYVGELTAYVGTIRSGHERLHTGGRNTDYEYGDGRNCFLDATDIMMEHMMYSVPASQVLAGLAGGSAAKLETALDAMEQTMTLFYQHKGLMKGAGGNKETPARHLNIRYMRMFAGAFMYASGNHIGIEWPQTTIASGAASWDSFGWGIAHEIGHDINDPKYAIAEITNNYFAQLLTGDYNGLRFNMEDVYKKVTSGTIGRSPNGAVQLALYWQLHLAFDNYTTESGGDRYLFSDYQTMFDNLFFARVDTYSRNPGMAKKTVDGVEIELKLDAGVDQNLMRLACAAANANILPFFERWGMVPNEDTVRYAQACGAETVKALWYVNKDARDYRAAHSSEDTGECSAVVTADISSEEELSASRNRVTIQMRSDGVAPEQVLGYEIIRSVYKDGQMLPGEVIGFRLADDDGSASYTDIISTMDNRVVYYEVRAVDKFLNYSGKVSAGSAKISTGGALGKDMWTVETTMKSDDPPVVHNDDDPDSGFDPVGEARKEESIYRIIDNETADRTVEASDDDSGVTQRQELHVYHGTASGSEQITIDMQKLTAVTAVNYMGTPLDSVSIEVSADGNSWITVKDDYTGLKTGECAAKFATIWFDSVNASEKDKWIGTYDARYIRFIIAHSGEVTINEVDICGPAGDNIEFHKADDALPLIGKAANTYVYDEKNNYSIPKGSLIFAGSYKGNPAYNVVVLYDQDGNVIGYDKETDEVKAEQVIFAEVPAQGNLGETSDGIWIYYVAPDDWTEESIRDTKRVRAELFRVDDAQTLDGERIVSDTAFVDVDTANLREITLTDSVKTPEMQ